MEFYQIFIEAIFWKKVELIFLVLFFAALLSGIAFAIHEKAHEIYKKTRLALYELFPKPSARSDMPPNLRAFVALRDCEIAELVREKRWNIVKSILYFLVGFPVVITAIIFLIVLWNAVEIGWPLACWKALGSNWCW